MTGTVKSRVMDLLSDGMPRDTLQITMELEPDISGDKLRIFRTEVRKALCKMEYWGEAERVDSFKSPSGKMGFVWRGVQ